MRPSLPVCRQKMHEPGFNCSLPPIGGRSRIIAGQGFAQVCILVTLLSLAKTYVQCDLFLFKLLTQTESGLGEGLVCCDDG